MDTASETRDLAWTTELIRLGGSIPLVVLALLLGVIYAATAVPERLDRWDAERSWTLRSARFVETADGLAVATTSIRNQGREDEDPLALELLDATTGDSRWRVEIPRIAGDPQEAIIIGQGDGAVVAYVGTEIQVYEEADGELRSATDPRGDADVSDMGVTADGSAVAWWLNGDGAEAKSLDLATAEVTPLEAEDPPADAAQSAGWDLAMRAYEEAVLGAENDEVRFSLGPGGSIGPWQIDETYSAGAGLTSMRPRDG
ncbi:hypothetical protein ACXET9_10700 [Brachybacterium sp. DNPG3]